MVCKRQEQCKFGKMCGWAKDEETLLTECVEFIERVPQTNEEWFINLPTKEKAKWLYDHYVNARADEYYGRQEKTLSEYQKWLVSVHREIDGTRVG